MKTLIILLVSSLTLVIAKSISTGEHFVEAIEDFIEEVAEIESKCYFYQYETEQEECESYYYGVSAAITIINLLIGSAIVAIFVFCCKKLFNCCKCCKKEPYIHPIK